MAINGRWIKLPASIGQESALAELAEEDALAALLWIYSLAAANWYGILPGEPRKYRTLVTPAITVSVERITEALTAQEKAGLIVRYEGDNQALIYIPAYHEWQQVPWWQTRQSEYPLPPEWQIPPKLAEMIESGSLARANRTFGRYGLSGSTSDRVGGGSGECEGRVGQPPMPPMPPSPPYPKPNEGEGSPPPDPGVTGGSIGGSQDSTDCTDCTDSTAFNDVRLGPDVDLNQESVPSPQNDPGRQSDSSERLNDPFGPPLRQTTAEGQPPAPDGADASPAPSGNDSLRQRGKGPTYEEIMATFSEDERRLVNEALDLLADWRPDGSRLENARQFVEVRDLAPAAFARVLAEGRRVDGGRGPKTVKYYRQIALAAASAPPEKWPKLRAAIGRLNMPPHTQDNWVRVLGNAVEGAGDKWVTSEDQIVALLAEYPPKAAEENLPVKWLERVEKARGSGSYAVPHTWVGGEWEALGFKVYQPRNETPEEGDGSEAATPAQEGRCAGFRHLMDEGVDANAVLEAMGFRVCRPKAPEEEEAPQSTTPEKKAQHETKTPEEGIVFDLNDFRPKTEGARDSPDLDAIQWDEPEGLEFDENGDEVEDWDEIEDDDYEAAQ